MNIFRQNTTPAIEIVPRYSLEFLDLLKFKIISEFTQITQEILADVSPLPNENYLVTLQDFPLGKVGEKFSYTLVDNITNEIVSLGKFIIVSETESIQDYSKSTNTKFYT